MKRVAVFLAVTFVLTWAYEFGVVYPIATGALVGLPATLTQLAVGGAMFFPALAVVVTRLVTREGFRNSVLKPRRFKQSFPWFLVAWFGPSVLIVVGAGVYFLWLRPPSRHWPRKARRPSTPSFCACHST